MQLLVTPVTLSECNKDGGGGQANEVSPSPERVDTHHLRICSRSFILDGTTGNVVLV